MADTKKEWQNLTLFEKLIRFLVPAIVLFITGLLPYFAYFVPSVCDIDAIGPYCWVHPGTAIVDPIGWVLWIFGGVWLSGVWQYLPGIDDDEDPWKTVTKVAWGCMIAGPLLIILV